MQNFAQPESKSGGDRGKNQYSEWQKVVNYPLTNKSFVAELARQNIEMTQQTISNRVEATKKVN